MSVALLHMVANSCCGKAFLMSGDSVIAIGSSAPVDDVIISDSSEVMLQVRVATQVKYRDYSNVLVYDGICEWRCKKAGN